TAQPVGPPESGRPATKMMTSARFFRDPLVSPKTCAKTKLHASATTNADATKTSSGTTRRRPERDRTMSLIVRKPIMPNRNPIVGKSMVASANVRAHRRPTGGEAGCWFVRLNEGLDVGPSGG